MKKKWSLLVVITLLVIMLIAAKPIEERVGQNLDLRTAKEFSANEPFHTLGLLRDIAYGAEYIGRLDIRLVVDGVEIDEDYIEFFPYKNDGDTWLNKAFIFNFPDGLEKGKHSFQMYYTDKCGIWLWFGFVSECENLEHLVEVKLKDAVVVFH